MFYVSNYSNETNDYFSYSWFGIIYNRLIFGTSLQLQRPSLESFGGTPRPLSFYRVIQKSNPPLSSQQYRVIIKDSITPQTLATVYLVKS